MDKNKFSKLDKAKDVRNDEEAQKYIKEMRKMDQINEKKGNKALLVSLVSVLVFAVGIGIYVYTESPNEASADKGTATVIDKSSGDKKDESTAKKDNSSEEQKENTEGKVEKENSTPEKPQENKNELYKLYEYAESEENRQASLDKAIELNQGSSAGVSAIMISQILRNNGYSVPEDTYSTKDLRDYLRNNGFTEESDLSKLKPGDICFTKDMDQIDDTPSHVYIFMGWKEEGKTAYAQVVDSHVADYGATLHERNIDETVDGKDKIHYFFTK